MRNNDFAKYLNDFINNLPQQDKYINHYLNGRITKQQLDEFMEGCKDEKSSNN